MKKYFYLIAFIIFSYSFTGSNDINYLVVNKSDVVACKIRQCNATAKSTGQRCKHCVSNNNDKQCWQHKPKKY
jgi:hypothetical protein